MTMRYMASNLITAASMLTVNSVASGNISDGFKQGTGSATMETGGTYTGAEQLNYYIEIDSIAGGAEVAQATFKWSDDGGATFDASGVATAATWVTLNNGVTVRWTTGTGADFVVGDYWRFTADAPFGKGKLIDLDRDKRYRSGGLASPEHIVIDLGSTKQVTCVVIQDHNFTNAATIDLMAHTADSWGAPDYAPASLTWNEGIIVVFLDQTFRYWRLEVTDAANGDGYIAIGELFLAAYEETTRQISAGQNWQYKIITAKDRMEHGATVTIGKNLGWIFNLRFHETESADYATLKGIVDAIFDLTTREFLPFYLCPAHGTPNETYLVETDGLSGTFAVQGRKTVQMVCTEKLKSTTD